MVVSQVVSLILWQVISIVSLALISQFVFTLYVKQKDNRAENAEPYKTEAQAEPQGVFRSLGGDEHIARSC